MGHQPITQSCITAAQIEYPGPGHLADLGQDRGLLHHRVRRGDVGVRVGGIAVQDTRLVVERATVCPGHRGVSRHTVQCARAARPRIRIRILILRSSRHLHAKR